MARRRYASNEYMVIEGLDQFIKELGVASAYMASVKTTFVKAASRALVVMARDRALALAAQNGVYKLASKDVRAAGVGTVVYGGKPYDMGAEFGAKQYKQFLAWKGNDDYAGYFFWPATRYLRDVALDAFLFGVWRQMSSLFAPRGLGSIKRMSASGGRDKLEGAAVYKHALAGRT